MLGVKKEDLANHSDSYQLTINDIKRMELAELNQELFDKLFGEEMKIRKVHAKNCY